MVGGFRHGQWSGLPSVVRLSRKGPHRYEWDEHDAIYWSSLPEKYGISPVLYWKGYAQEHRPQRNQWLGMWYSGRPYRMTDSSRSRR